MEKCIPRFVSKGRVDHLEPCNGEQKDVEFSDAQSGLDPAARRRSIAQARQGITTAARNRIGVKIELLNRPEYEPALPIKTQMLGRPDFARSAVRKHMRERGRASIGKNAANCGATRVPVFGFEPIEERKHSDFTGFLGEPFAQAFAHDGQSAVNIRLPCEHAIHVDFAAPLQRVGPAGQTHCMALGKAQRLEQFAILERTRQIVGRTRLNQRIEMVDIRPRNQDKKRCSVDFHGICQRPDRSQPVIKRTTRIDDGDHCRAGNEALFRIVRPPRRDGLPACLRHGRRKFIAMPERQKKQRGFGRTCLRGHRDFRFVGGPHEQVIAWQASRANSPICLPATPCRPSNIVWQTNPPF